VNPDSKIFLIFFSEFSTSIVRGKFDGREIVCGLKDESPEIARFGEGILLAAES
jgi:hypothetical protein